MKHPDATVRAAQRGTPLSEVYVARPTRRRPLAPARKRAARRSSTRTASRRDAAARTTAASAAEVTPLDEAERLALIQAFTGLLEGLYTHLPLKRAMYAIDPVQRLRLLAQRAGSLDDLAFHQEMASILTRLRDAHTRYVGPSGLAGKAAMLPFMVEGFGAPPEARYIVSNLAKDPDLLGDPKFEEGVELLWWNAVPIDRAVDRYAEYETGGRPDSRRARALETLTFRSLQFSPPPDEHWVVVGYRDLDDEEREVRIPWRVVEPGQAGTAGSGQEELGLRFAIDPAGEVTRRVKKLLFAPDQWLRDRRRGTRRRSAARAPRAAAGDWLESEFEDTLSARDQETPSGTFGYLRLWSFDINDDQAYVEEVVRLLGLLSGRGLIIDLRGNPGGSIWAAERLLQLFTPRPVSPTRFSFLATPLTRAMAQAPQNEGELSPWRDSLDDAVATGEVYSQAVPITPFERCNDVGQVYGGPVVAVVDANTYSAGDLFAAGFHDNDLGTLVTVGEATGAGGANVWAPADVRQALLGTAFEPPDLPGGVGYSISVRRATRGAGAAEGAPIEDTGVRGHRSYGMTREDLLQSNRDLLAFCGELLAAQTATAMQVGEPGDEAVEVTTEGLDRLDVFVDGRPHDWFEVKDGLPTSVTVPEGWDSIELRGYAKDDLRQRRIVTA